MPTNDDDMIGGVPEPVAAPASAARDGWGGDPAVLAVLGGAGGNAQGQLAVASTIANRKAALKAPSAAAVVLDPAQGYEEWQSPKDRANYQRLYPVDGPAYQAAAARVEPILSGQQAPPFPYTHYYGPTAQASRGRAAPSWDDGSGVNVGGNLFFTKPIPAGNVAGAADESLIGGVAETGPAAPGTPLPKQAAGADPFAKAFGVQPASADPNLIPLVDSTGKNIGYASGPQSETVRGLMKAGRYDPGADEGSETHPYAYPAGTRPVRGGTWFIDHDSGKLTQYQDPDSAVNTVAQVGQDLANPVMAGIRQSGVIPGTDPRAQAIESGFGSGALMGGKNELTAAVQAIPGALNGQGYDNAFTQALATNDARDAVLRTRFPMAHDAAAVAGAGASAIAGDAAGNLLVRGAGALLPEAADAVAANPLLRIPGRLATRGAVGAGLGGAQGYLAGGPGVSEAQREQQAGQGETGGLILGELAPFAGDVLGAGGRILGAGKVAAPDAAAKVGNALMNAIERDGKDPADVIAAARANPLAPAFHAGGQNLHMLADTAANVPGPAMTTVRNAAADHLATIPTQVKADIGTALGGKGDYLDTLDQTLAARRLAANQGMEAVAGQPVSLNENSVQALRSPMANTAVKNAAQLALASPDPIVRASGANLNRIADTVLDNPAAATMTVRDAQNISKSLLDGADAAFKGGNGAQGTALKGLGRAIRDNASDPAQGGNAAYQSWLSKYGDDSDNIDALDLGHDVFKGGANTAAQVSKTLSGMGPQAQDFYRKGVAEALIDQSRMSQGGVGTMRALLRTEELRDKVRLAFPDQDSYGQFVKAAEQRVQEHNANMGILGGSPTAPRQAARADLEAQPLGAADVIPHVVESLGHAVTGNAPALFGKGLKMAMKNIPRQDRSIIGDPQTNALLGQALTDPEAMAGLLTAAGNGNKLGARFVPRPKPVRAITPLAVGGVNLLLHPPAPLPQGPVALPAQR